MTVAIAVISGLSNARAGYIYNTADSLDPQFDPTYFGSQVVSGTGTLGQTATDTLYNNSSAILGAPNLWFSNNPSLGMGAGSDMAKIVEAPYYKVPGTGNDLVTQLNYYERYPNQAVADPGTIVIKMGSPVVEDPTHAYGIDFMVYGNSFFVGSGGAVNNATDMNSYGIGGLNGHATSVAVSPDGVNWYTYPDVQSLLPYNAYQWNQSGATWSSQPMDPLKPVNPGVDSLLPLNISGLSASPTTTAAAALELYDGASGGTGYSLQGTGFSSIQYIKLTTGYDQAAGAYDYTVVDAVAKARSMVVGDHLSITPDNVTQGTASLYFQDAGNSNQTLIKATFVSVSSAADLATGYFSDATALGMLSGQVLQAYSLGMSSLTSASTKSFTANVDLFTGSGYSGNGSDLSVSAWNGSGWSNVPFIFDASANMVDINGLSNLDVLAISKSTALVWNNAGISGDGVTWDVGINQNWAGSSTGTFVNGAGVVFSDSNNGHYGVILNTVVSPGSILVNNSAGSYSIRGTGSITGATGLIKSGSERLILATSNGYTGSTLVNGGVLELAVTGALPVNNALSIAAGAQVVMDAQTGLLQLDSLNLDPAGRLDLTDNGLVLHGGNLDQITAAIALGCNDLAWNGGAGITSSTAAGDTTHLGALGVILNGSIYTSSFDGVNGLNLSSTDVLVRYTDYGDANLDGRVDGSDYSLIDSGFLLHATGWFNGDFNYDGVINGSDYTLIDNAFNRQGAGGADAQITTEVGSTVPEPVFAGLALLNLALLRRAGRRGQATGD